MKRKNVQDINNETVENTKSGRKAGKSQISKFSAYLKDDSILENLRLLADYQNVSFTSIVEQALKNYVLANKSDIDFIRDLKQKDREAIEQRKSNNNSESQA